jgi:hypothetical protein
MVAACWATKGSNSAQLGKHIRHTVFKSWIGVCLGGPFLGVLCGDLILEGAGHGEGRGKTDAA